MVNGPSAADYAVPAAELDAKIIDLKHNGGLTFQAIADHLGLSKGYVHRCFWRGVRSIAEPAATAYRAAQLARIEMAREAVLEVMAAKHLVVSNGHIVSEIVGHHPLVDDAGEPHPLAGEPIYGDPLIDDGPVLAAVDRLDKLDDREARLLGLYPASKLDLGGTVNYTITGIDPASLQ